MAPKKIDPKKLLKKAVDAKSKKEKPTITVTPSKKKPLVPGQIKQQQKDEDELREFFTQVSTLQIPMEEDPSEIVNELFSTFSNSHPSTYWPTKLIDRILVSLDPLLYIDFSKKYIEQNTKNLTEFFNSYVDNPKIAERLRNYYEKMDMEHMELDRKQAIADKLFDHDEEIIEVMGPIKKPKDYKTKYKHTKYINKYIIIDPKTGEEIELPPPKVSPRSYKKHKQKIRPMVEINCKQAFINSEWVGDVINTVYISSTEEKDISSLPLASGWEIHKNIEGGVYYLNSKTNKKQLEKPINMPDFADIDPAIKPYINSQQSAIINKNIIWYPVNQLFFDLLCNPSSIYQKQVGDVFTARGLDTKDVSMKIGFGTDRKFIILDEKLFSKWKKYKQTINMGRQEKLKIILKEPFNPILKELGEIILSTALHRVAPTVEDYGYIKEIANPNEPGEKINILISETQYITDVLTELSSKSITNEDFINHLAVIVAALNNEQATLFHSRIIDRYYLPEILGDLSLEEIYPAILSNTLGKTIIDNNLVIIESKNRITFGDILNMFYKKLYPTERSPTLSQPNIVINLPKGCINPDDIDMDKRIYYRSSTDDRVFCLDLDDIIQQLVLTDTYINPVTNLELDPGFLYKFKLLYHKELELMGYIPQKDDDDVLPTGGEDIKEPKEEELAPDLLDLIYSKLDQCEKEIKEDTLTPDGKCPSLSEDTTPEGEDTTPEGEDTDDEEDTEEDTDDEEDAGVDLKDLFGSDDSSDDDSKHSKFSGNNEYCEKCTGRLTNSKYKTIKLENDQYRTLNFCGPKCFEKYNHFSKDKKGKKGRNGTKERKE